MMRPPTPASRAVAGWRLRTLLCLAMLVPLVGASLLAGAAIRERDTVRSASVGLERAASGLGIQAAFVSALGQEEVHSNVLGLATTYEGLGLDRGMVGARLAGARALVDSRRFDDLRAELGLDDELRELRRRLDTGRADFADVSAFFSSTDSTLEDAWADAMSAVDRAADRAPLVSELRRQIRSLRGTMAAFSLSDDRVLLSLSVFLDGPTAESTEALIAANARFDAGVAAALEDASPGMTATWVRWKDDPASERTEATMALAVEAGLQGVAPVADIDPVALTAGLSDGARWAILLTDVVRVASTDLEEAASRRADQAARSMIAQIASISLLALVSGAVVVTVARSITRPMRRLEGAARRVEAGDFELDELPARGPREVVATARAFNDMTATLAAVEDHAVALATDPSAPVLAQPLPGRTGEALQATLDNLRASIAEAEAHRDELAELAAKDGLTGLLNRSAALGAVERDLARSRRDGSVLLALYIDLDGLKDLNDTYGHAVGDEAIRRTATALAHATRDGDVVARLGGDEFLVVGPLPPGGRADADALAQRLLAAVHDEVLDASDGSRHALRCSIGAATSVDAPGAVDELVRAADAALYRAKQAGRHQVAWYDDAVSLPG